MRPGDFRRAVGVAGAVPVPPAAGPSAGLVPGVAPGPAQPWSLDTPDQALTPVVYTPSAEEDAVEPRSAEAGTTPCRWYGPAFAWGRRPGT
ncbi:hypothetical protein [Streptomyces iakyrus]